MITIQYLCTHEQLVLSSLDIFLLSRPSSKDWSLQGATVAEGESPWAASWSVINAVQVDGGILLRLTTRQESDAWNTKVNYLYKPCQRHSWLLQAKVLLAPPYTYTCSRWSLCYTVQALKMKQTLNTEILTTGTRFRNMYNRVSSRISESNSMIFPWLIKKYLIFSRVQVTNKYE